MYSRTVTDAALDAASQKQGWQLERHSQAQVDHAIAHFSDLWDAEARRLVRPLEPEEDRFIRNERKVCALDFRYWTSNYGYIVNYHRERQRFTPNVAQNIILNLWADREEAGLAIWMQELKARRLGVSTLSELNVNHRFQFHPLSNCVVASADPTKTLEMAGMIKYNLDNQPWWLLPQGETKIKQGMIVEFGDIRTNLTIQAGNQFTGVARGSTPNVIHLSELMEWQDAEDLIDGALMRAVIDTPNVFGILESTGGGMGTWWHRTWEQNKRDYSRGRARVIPVFLPWYVGTDLYPSAADLLARPVPSDWTPSDRSVAHAERAKEYVRSNPLLFEYLAKGDRDWRLSREQMWFREIEYETAKEKKQLHIFHMELCVAGDQRVSTDQGIVRIDDAKSALLTETGQVLRWSDNGEKELRAIGTKMGRLLKVTADHRIKLSDGTWREADELQPGDELQLSPPRFATKPYIATWNWSPVCTVQTEIDEDWARFLGIFIGDGCWVTDGVSIANFSEDEDTIAEVMRLCTKIVGRAPTARTPKGVRMVEVRSNSVLWWEMLWNLGVLRPHLHKREKNRRSGYKKNLAVPECIWRSQKAVVAAFLQGLFETDGHANKANAQTLLFSKSESLIREVQLLLMGFGINAGSIFQEKTNGDGRKYTGRVLRLNALNSDIFHREIGFFSERKRTTGKRSATGQGYRGRPPLPVTMTDTVEWVGVSAPERVYDLTIAETHQFGANGVMVHNCADDFEAFQSSNIPVIDPEILLSYQERTRPPIAVYTIIGPDIPPALITPRRFWDARKQPLTVSTREILPRYDVKYQLMPLLFEGYPSFDEGLKLLVWEMPETGYTYGVGVDCAEGLGQDNAVIQAMREATPDREPGQVAEWASNLVTAFQLWPLVLAVGTLYSTYSPFKGGLAQCRMAIETQTNGASVQNELQKRGWSNFHPWKYNDKRRPTPDGSVGRLGILTNYWFRSSMMDMLLTSLSEEAIDLPSPYLVNELITLERAAGEKKAKAAPDCHDDRVMALGFPLFSLHMNKPPAKQYTRRRVSYQPGLQEDERPAHPIWTPPAYATAQPYSEQHHAVQGVGRRNWPTLKPIRSRFMPDGFR